MNIFDSIRIKRPGRSLFDLSHEKKLSCRMSNLVPVFVQDVIPGDKFNVNSEQLLRFAPLVSPMMHRVNVFTHFFFVPYRIIWNEWESFITGGESGTENPGFPKINIDNYTKDLCGLSSLADYLGVPQLDQATQELEISALPFRAYQMIYNEYYRDQNLISEISFSKGSTLASGDEARLLAIRKRAWEKDYFTSALPWAQRGASVSVPLDIDYLDQSLVKKTDGTDPTTYTRTSIKNGGTSNPDELFLSTDDTMGVQIQNLSDQTGVDLSILRYAVKLQEWLEKNARGGSRYIEQIFSHFGVKSSDARLQRPEYLGGGKQPVMISEVLNTAGSGDLPQGNMAGHGLSVGNTNRFSKFFEEHGIIIGIMSILPRTAYQEGLPREFVKFNKLDYYFPEFANLGEQPVYDFEVRYNPDSVLEDQYGTFGYQQRFAEYKFRNSTVHGQFKATLNFWHMGRIFGTQPALNEAFVSANPTDRVFAVEDEDQDNIYVQIYNNVKALRPMPYQSIPSFI